MGGDDVRSGGLFCASDGSGVEALEFAEGDGALDPDGVPGSNVRAFFRRFVANLTDRCDLVS